MQEQLRFVLCYFFRQVDQCQDPIHVRNKLSPPPPPLPSSLLSAGNWEEKSPWRYFWQPTTQYHCKREGNCPPGLVSPWHSVLGQSQGSGPQNFRGHKPACDPTQATTINFHYKQSQSTLRKPFSLLKLRGKKEVWTQTFKHNILVCSRFLFLFCFLDNTGVVFFV